MTSIRHEDSQFSIQWREDGSVEIGRGPAGLGFGPIIMSDEGAERLAQQLLLHYSDKRYSAMFRRSEQRIQSESERDTGA